MSWTARESAGSLAEFVHHADLAEVQLPTSPSMHLDWTAAYFHPPLNTTEPLQVNLTAKFRGGVLTNHYPYAPTSHASSVGRPPRTESVIEWRQIRVGDIADPFETSSTTWQLARAVTHGATLKVYKPGPPGTQPDDPGTTEGDVFLFYRGAGAVEAPLITKPVPAGRVELSASMPGLYFPSTWIYAARARGESALRHLGDIDTGTSPTSTFETEFADSAFSIEGHAQLRFELRQALNAEGLHDDVSAAAIATLEELHVRNPGRTLVYLVPEAWTNHVLPLEVSDTGRVEKRVLIAVQSLPD